MFDPTSRYAKLAVKTQLVPDPHGDGTPREIRHVERRFLPPAEASAPVVEHAVVEGDRLDNVTAKYLGDPTQFWRVADANTSLRPEELTDEPGSRVVIALPRQ
ncbi:MAG: LysM domain-containing protein [Verrucomicrobia bacterium]|nr:MAG: LysM domain-containing protein [Verrucomicrobiota bacterium]